MVNSPTIVIPDEDSSIQKRLVDTPIIKQKDFMKLVKWQIKDALAQTRGSGFIQKGKPYPKEFYVVYYLMDFPSPSFRIFNNIGKPKQ